MALILENCPSDAKPKAAVPPPPPPQVTIANILFDLQQVELNLAYNEFEFANNYLKAKTIMERLDLVVKDIERRAEEEINRRQPACEICVAEHLSTGGVMDDFVNITLPKCVISLPNGEHRCEKHQKVPMLSTKIW